MGDDAYPSFDPGAVLLRDLPPPDGLCPHVLKVVLDVPSQRLDGVGGLAVLLGREDARLDVLDPQDEVGQHLSGGLFVTAAGGDHQFLASRVAVLSHPGRALADDLDLPPAPSGDLVVVLPATSVAPEGHVLTAPLDNLCVFGQRLRVRFTEYRSHSILSCSCRP